MSSTNNRPILDDVNVIVAGQGGDGSLTVITMLAELLRTNGLNVYTERDVLSRIRGGHAAATMRASAKNRYCIGSNINLLVALDEEAIQKNARHLDSKSIVVYDDSGGPAPSVLPNEMKVYSAPFNRIAMRTMRRELYKNSIAFGVVGRILGLEDEMLRETFISHFKRMGQVILELPEMTLWPSVSWLQEANSTAATPLRPHRRCWKPCRNGYHEWEALRGRRKTSSRV
jgi:2-oxoglutarate ferredoxin oxidoreductase subunit alpha